MSLRDSLKPYLDPSGLVQNRPGGESGNGLLFTAEAYGLMAERGELTDEDRASALHAVASCLVAPGFYQRGGGDLTPEQQDDLIGLAYLSVQLQIPELADSILEFLEDHLGFYTLGKKTWDTFLYRFLPMLCALRYAACRGGNFFIDRATAWAISSSSKKAGVNQDPWILNRLILKTVAGRSAPLRFAEGVYLSERKKAFPGGMPAVYTRYFGGAHPIALYSSEEGL